VSPKLQIFLVVDLLAGCDERRLSESAQGFAACTVDVFGDA
jgi:hypothetical protein